MKDISNFSVLLFLFMFTYTLLGMEMFGYKVKFNSEGQVDLKNGKYPNSTFNTFTEGFASVFIILANDGWSTIFFDHYRAIGPIQALIFFLSLLIIGQFILLNLFLAILLQNFDDENLNPQEVKNSKKDLNKSQKIQRKNAL